jgi:hypothetical protein
MLKSNLRADDFFGDFLVRVSTKNGQNLFKYAFK